MTNQTRRSFLQTSTAAALATGIYAGHATAAPTRSPLEKLNIACIGTANRAAADVNGVMTENIVALCDVDGKYLEASKKMLIEKNGLEPRVYADYREMIEAEGDKIDAVTVATTDHHHAPATMQAIKAGKHVYCEKPLTHTVKEARMIAEAAAEAGVATQLGTQIHAGDNYRRVVEIIQSGAIGDVTDVHVWVGKGWGITELTGKESAPPEWLSWDLWLGPAPERPYVAGRYHPAQWRRFWDFGQGTLGDMACHFMDLPFWALDLKHPTHCEAEGAEVNEEMCPTGLVVRYKFPTCNLTWYDGDMIPKQVAGERVPASGVMFVGTEGKMFADYGRYRLYPSDKFTGFKPPEQTIPKSIGHHQEWIKACKDGSPTTCNFDYSGALTETVLLGNVAYRTGKSLEWDAKNLKATNCPEADAYITKEYRSGWVV
ncbi:Gfo/Idh/MocA family protein [Fuerstiella marisgermanici]|uniref:Inositol 2-dehydrogenase n=1 Tax=Fuerstiella marisgermanici TaxID=1891926 RepID=A0A1P8WME1_9PLAN|nr:Gfo/Idh/MocA family oxidoreductase [Fuerstiella marisgermanici]APZ95225.1 Inositol 2-dehydrogenase [Fuerstiella marisgermanici]